MRMHDTQSVIDDRSSRTGRLKSACHADQYGERKYCSTLDPELELLCIPSEPVDNRKPINSCRACGGLGEPCCPDSINYDSDTCPKHRRPDGQQLTCSGVSSSDVPSEAGQCQRCGKVRHSHLLVAAHHGNAHDAGHSVPAVAEVRHGCPVSR